MKKRRLLSIVLSLCMVLTLCLVTGMLSTVTYAEPSGTELTKEYLDKNCKVGDGCYSLSSGNYYLSEDILVGTYIDIGAEGATANVVLDLNGHELKNQKGILLCIDYSSTLTLTDSSPTESGKVIDEKGNYVGSNCTLYANGGTIEGEVLIYEGVIDNTDPSNVTVFTGEVTNWAGTIKGGIFTGTIEIDGGTIEDRAKVTVTFDSDNGNIVQEDKVLRGQYVNEPTAPTKDGYEFAGWYNGDTEYDFTQNVTENITLTAHWESVEVPVITVLENGKTYCDAVEFEVTDNVGVASVKAGDLELSPTNGKYTLEKGIGKVEVVAKDNAGNKTSVTVTVNNGHTAGVDDGDCSTPVYCIYHPTTVVVEAKSHDFSGDWNKDTDGHWHICQNEGCTVTDTPVPHSGGSATCTAKAECEHCGAEYGELDSSNHDLVNTPAKDATVTETGNEEYWQCKNCKKYFSDEKGTNEISLEDTVIQKLPPEIIEGEGQSITAGEKKALSFTSNAAFSDFIRVELDGKTLDEKNYTVKEGSTIVTLKADYVATLSAGEHTIGIVSESGTATTTFTVEEKAASGTTDDSDKDSKSDNEDSAKTGDNANLALWLALMILSGAGITGVTAYTRRKRTNE